MANAQWTGNIRYVRTSKLCRAYYGTEKFVPSTISKRPPAVGRMGGGRSLKRCTAFILAIAAAFLTAGCSGFGGTADSEQTASIPPRPRSVEQGVEQAKAAGLNDLVQLDELHYAVSSDWSMREEDATDTGDMIARIYTVPGEDGAALDVLRKGISLIERDALEEGKRNLGSIGQFTKQWESTYGLTLTTELTDRQLPEGAQHGWVFESLTEGRGGRGIILVADMYMFAVYYAAEDAADNPFTDIWDALVGSLWIDAPQREPA